MLQGMLPLLGLCCGFAGSDDARPLPLPGPTNAPAVVERRACFQQKLRESLAYDLNPNYFLIGCNQEPIWAFEEWSANTGCGNEPLDGTLFIHTAWVGPIDSTLAGKQSVQRDFEALLESFLMTQNLDSTKMIVWWMDRDPNLADPFEARYIELGRGAIEFRRPNLRELAKGTPLEGNDEVLTMGDNLVVSHRNKRPRQLANMFRTLILHIMGGIWVDTDTLMLKDFRPLYEFTGEFATQLSMSKYYNNNFMGLRKGSATGHHMLQTIVDTGLPTFDPVTGNKTYPAKYCQYVTRSGGDCYDVWYWNHGSLQLLVREKVGIVVLPTPYSDPGYQGCYAPYLMGWHGGLRMRGLSVAQILEIIRGSFIIHTRAYNAKKPMHPESNFARLYDLVRAGAMENISAPVPANPAGIGRRSAEAEEAYQTAWMVRQRLTPGVMRSNAVEPPWYPPKPRLRVMIKAQAFDACMVQEKRSLKDLGDNPPVAMAKCPQSPGAHSVKYSWAFHPEVPGGPGGFIRPWVLRPKKLLCLDGAPEEVFGRRLPDFTTVALVVCDRTRAGQRWLHSKGRLVNYATRKCLDTFKLPKFQYKIDLQADECTDREEQDFEMVTLDDVEGDFGLL